MSVPQCDAKGVTFKGKHLDQVNAVRFDTSGLKFKAADGGKSILIQVTRTVTAKPSVLIVRARRFAELSTRSS